MQAKNQLKFDLQMMELPSLRTIIGDVPTPDVNGRKISPNPHNANSSKKISAVKRIIACLQKE
jgi:hypothetical protein